MVKSFSGGNKSNRHETVAGTIWVREQVVASSLAANLEDGKTALGRDLSRRAAQLLVLPTSRRPSSKTPYRLQRVS